MPLVDLKLTKKEKEKDTSGPMTADYTPPDYPWGLEIRLGPEELKKLGVEALTSGSEVLLTSRARVKSFTVESRDGKDVKSAELVLEKMEIADSVEKTPDSKVFYKDSGDK